MTSDRQYSFRVEVLQSFLNGTGFPSAQANGPDVAALLAAIVANADDAIVSKTLEGIVTSWNRGAELMFGYTAAEAVGRSITLIIPPERLPEEAEILDRMRRGETIDHFETERLTKAGPRVPISLSVSPVRDGGGRVIGIAKIARDISERKAAEARLEATVQTLETLYRLADRVGRATTLQDVCDAAVEAVMAAGAHRASVLVLDDAGVMRFRAWRNLSDRYRAAVDGHSPWPAETIDASPIMVEDVLADPTLAELRAVVSAEGVRALAFVPLVHHGRLLGTFMTYYDGPHEFAKDEVRLAMTIAHHVAFGVARIRAEAEIEALLARERAAGQAAEAARAEADAANRAKDRFLAVLSHELRTPLNAILGWTRLLRNARLPDGEGARALEVIERNARLQAQLVADLLDVSRIGVGKMEVERGPVDLVLVARQAIEAVTAEVAAKKLDLSVELEESAGDVLGDPNRLQQVISNVLSNAIKFTPERGRIDVRLARQAGTARLTVTDTGEGIEPALLSRIFEAFEQGDSSMTRRHRGLGLGLAIVRQIVQLHGGVIRAQSRGRGQGATFTIDLPLIPRSARPGP